jgi:hypothetical protein
MTARIEKNRRPSGSQLDISAIVCLGHQGIVRLLHRETRVYDRFRYGDPPFYGQVKRDNVRLALRLVCEPVFVGRIREREQLLSASITVDTAVEIKQLFLEFQTAGVTFHGTRQTEPWGTRNFVVMNSDRNLILFAGPAD